MTFLLSYGQYDWTPGELILKNGTSLKGLIKIPTPTNDLVSIKSSKIQFKKDKKSSRKKFGKEQVDKIFFGTTNPNLGYYEYVPISKNKMSVFKLIRNGKAKLYTRTKRITINLDSKINDPNGTVPFGANKFEKIKEYYVIRKGEDIVTSIINSHKSISKKEDIRSFNRRVTKYFSDCKDVISYIENDLYEEFDIAQIVDDYNLLCE